MASSRSLARFLAKEENMVRCKWTPEGIRVRCTAGCGREFLVTDVTEAQFNAWKSGTLIQVAMPEISKGVRELLISGTCDECWDRMFAFDEGDGDDEQVDVMDGGPDNIKDERI
jgi:hypothetical protein